MRQTTVLIAEMATSFGIRAPLAHIADQVFLELSREIEQHGVSRGVAADMFGMTLRTYQRKVTRLREGATVQAQTLWGAVFEHVRQRKSCTRAELLAAFARDDAEEVGAVLNDLVTSGLLYATGRGPGSLFGLTTEEDQRTLARWRSQETLSHLIWLALAELGGASRSDLPERFAVSKEQVDEALTALLHDGRIQQVDADGQRFVAARVLIPVGSEAGWESAVFDHFRAVCAALVNKLRARGAAPLRDR